MTIISMKPGNAPKKPDCMKSPLVPEDWPSEEAKVDILLNRPLPVPLPPRKSSKRSSDALLCMTAVALLMVVIGMTCGLMLYRQYFKTNVQHFKSFCAIPLEDKEDQEPQEQLIEPNYREERLAWSTEPLTVVSLADDNTSNNLVKTFREELDIDGKVEKIRVNDNRKTVSFIHDFNDNSTAIVDNRRCFVMDLNPETTLNPETFMFGIQNGDKFDVSRVRNTVRAILPALVTLSRQAEVFAQLCIDKPVYQLKQEEGSIVSKRSVDGPAHDFIHFSGQRVQEIAVSNMDEILNYEKYKALP